MSPTSAEMAAGKAGRWEKGEEKREVEEQPEAALMRCSGGEERRLATSAGPGTLALKETALDQDEGGKGPRGGWRSRGAGYTERDKRPLSRRG